MYNLLEIIIPFKFMEYEFMKNAFLAILLISPLFAMLGTMIVNNKMAFFSDALGHSALTGIAIGTMFGIASNNVSMILFAIIFAIVLNVVKSKNINSADTIISVFSSVAIAIGLAILSKSGGFNKYSGFLIGDILSITRAEIVYLFLIGIIVVAFWVTNFNRLNAISINETLARSKGINVQLINNVFAVIIAIVVMVSIRWIGILLINSLLILPAAASRNISKNIRQYTIYSIVFALFSGVTGLIISYYNIVPTGPMIVIISGCIYFITFILREKVR